jgi:PAS domain-containing protein
VGPAATGNHPAGSLDSLSSETVTVETVKARIHQCFRKTADIVMQRNRRFKQIETELYEKEKSLSQIIQGSTIPTFVINRDHVVTHWNHAAEVLTGYRADRDGRNAGSLEALSKKANGRSWPM